MNNADMRILLARKDKETAELKEELDRVRKLLHYPDCWDTVAYPTIYDAINEMFDCYTCALETE